MKRLILFEEWNKERFACIKMALEFKDADIIDDNSEAWMPEDEDIQSHINRAKEEMEKWTKIY